MNKAIKVIIFLILAVNIMFSFNNIYAENLRDRLDRIDDNTTLQKVVRDGGMSTDRNLPSLVSFVIKTVLGIFALVTLIFIIQSGIKWFTAKGMPDKIQESRKVLTSSIIGMFIISTAYASTDFVINQIMLMNNPSPSVAENSGYTGEEINNCNPGCAENLNFDQIFNYNACKDNSVVSNLSSHTFSSKCDGKSIKEWKCICSSSRFVNCIVCKE